MKEFLSKKAWSPYVAGIVVGLLQIPAFLIIKSALGASSSYVSFAGYISSIFDWSITDNTYFNKYMTSLKYAWQSSLLIGIVLGAYFSMKLSGSKRKSFSPIWKKSINMDSLIQRSAMGFIGGFVLLFGARWAGGCTSGHGLSGTGQLSISSIIVVIMMFIGGALVSNLFKRL